MTETTNAPKAPAANTPKLDSGKVVKYIGSADVREIDANAWNSIGVKDQKKVVWNKANRWTVPVADLNDNALQYLDEDDNGFAVVDADSK